MKNKEITLEDLQWPVCAQCMPKDESDLIFRQVGAMDGPHLLRIKAGFTNMHCEVCCKCGGFTMMGMYLKSPK